MKLTKSKNLNTEHLEQETRKTEILAKRDRGLINVKREEWAETNLDGFILNCEATKSVR